jgi:hypothetical protein
MAGTTRPPALLNRKEKLSLIHIAKKETGLSDKTYRLLLEGAVGVSSAADISSENQFNAIMKAFAALGFISRAAREKTTARPRWMGSWGCTENQRAKIESMWKTCARTPTDTALRAFVKRIGHVDSPVFLRPLTAQKVILALEDMMKKAGFDPKTGEIIKQ